MVLSASGFQVLARRPSFGLAHTWSGLHTPHLFPPSLVSLLLHGGCLPLATQTWRKMFISALRGWGGGVAHSTFLFTKQFVCDYVNVLRLIQATVWTSGVHSSSDQSLSHSRPSTSAVLTAEAYDDMWAVALKFHTHTHPHTSQSYSGVFFSLATVGNEKEKKCALSPLLHNQSGKVAAVSSIFLYSFNFYCCFSGWATHTHKHSHAQSQTLMPASVIQFWHWCKSWMKVREG